jgi:voltage-dependent calcium channel
LDLTTADFVFLVFTFIYLANIIIRLFGLTWARFRRSTWDLYAVFAVTGTLVTTFLVLVQEDNAVFNRLQKLFLVSIALLLIPRNNQLDQLFKTAAASLPFIINLLATWFVLFLVFAIALTQAFSLTRFGANETDNLNLRDVPKAMILLFRSSVGEGWNQIMEDFANVRPPFCVEGSIFNSDCGSANWARFLFVAWNILSMYLFANLFISLIYESFSYVYQHSSGLSIISREEIRRFKEAWAVVDPDGTGYINKEALPKLLRELSGVFEMRIYDGDFTVKRLTDDCAKDNRGSTFSTISAVPPSREIDLKKLSARLASLPVQEIRRRRARLRQFYEEVLVSSERERGIEFNTFLMILAHYKVINDNKSLRLNEFLRRRTRLQRVDEAVRRQIVIGFFDTVFWRRYLRMHQEHQRAGRIQTVPQLMVPEIYVEDPDSATGPTHSRDVSVDDGPGALTPGSSPRSSGLATPPHRNSIQISPPISPRGRLTPQVTGADRHAPSVSPPSGGAWAVRRPSFDVPHLELTAADDDGPDGDSTGSPISGAARSRANSSVSVQGVMDALDSSAWGESLRRSFSTRRLSVARSRAGTLGGSNSSMRDALREAEGDAGDRV